MEVEPEQIDDTLVGMLEAFFILNQERENNSRHLTYRDIPKHFVYNSRERRWRTRQRRGDRVIARIHQVSAYNVECFALRVLLLHVLGPTCYRDVRTVTGHVFDTFREAAQELNLIRNDDVFFRAFEELRQMQMPPAFRRFLASLLISQTITNGLVFWERYKLDMIEDFRRRNRNKTEAELIDMALHDLNRMFRQTRKSCLLYGLPMPGGPQPAFEDFTQPDLIQQPIVLNPAQQNGFDRIMTAARNRNNVNNNCFVVIGPGGSGKTTLYKSIIKACKSENLVVNVFATTGIASTLIEGGMTMHSGFGIPFVIDQGKTSYLLWNPDSDQAKVLRRSDVILIDEISMATKGALRIIDHALRFLVCPQSPLNLPSFGGKVIVLGGDFRQLLPVVPGGSRTHILDQCVISSPLWNLFLQNVINLAENMRAGT